MGCLATKSSSEPHTGENSGLGKQFVKESERVYCLEPQATPSLSPKGSLDDLPTPGQEGTVDSAHPVKPSWMDSDISFGPEERQSPR